MTFLDAAQSEVNFNRLVHGTEIISIHLFSRFDRSNYSVNQYGRRCLLNYKLSNDHYNERTVIYNKLRFEWTKEYPL
jgi:hypothetical protein